MTPQDDSPQAQGSGRWPTGDGWVRLGFGTIFLALGATMAVLTGGTGTIDGFTPLENAIGATTTFGAIAGGLACLLTEGHSWCRHTRKQP